MEENNRKKENVKSVYDDAKIVKTDAEEVNGQDKCPKCGSTDISLFSYCSTILFPPIM